MTTNHATFSEVKPGSTRIDAASQTTPLEDLVERLRGVRLKVGRWLPNADALAAWSVDYAEVFKAATQLDLAVQELDAHMAQNPVECETSTAHSRTLQLLLCSVEERATAFEETVIENLAAGN